MAWKQAPQSSEAELVEFARREKRKAKLLVDESLGIGTTTFLRAHGWNAKDLSEVGLCGHPDENVFNYAFKHDRMLLTHDEDFLDDRRFPPYRNPGIVVLPGASGNSGELIRAIFETLPSICLFRNVFRASKTHILADGISITSMRNPETGAIERRRFRFTRNGELEEWSNLDS